MTYKEAIDYLQPVADNTPLSGYGAALTAAIYALHKMEEGAVPVVRCKDCIHYLPMDGTVDLGLCRAGYTGAKADGFCSSGEWRADNG